MFSENIFFKKTTHKASLDKKHGSLNFICCCTAFYHFRRLKVSHNSIWISQVNFELFFFVNRSLLLMITFSSYFSDRWVWVIWRIRGKGLLAWWYFYMTACLKWRTLPFKSYMTAIYPSLFHFYFILVILLQNIPFISNVSSVDQRLVLI